jgi:hypothetical protein
LFAKKLGAKIVESPENQVLHTHDSPRNSPSHVFSVSWHFIWYAVCSDKIGPESEIHSGLAKGDTSVKRKRKTVPRNEREAQARSRALHALAKMRREKLSLAEACRLEHIKPVTFRHYVGSAAVRPRFKRVGKPLRERVLVPRVEVERFLQMEEPANSS